MRANVTEKKSDTPTYDSNTTRFTDHTTPSQLCGLSATTFCFTPLHPHSDIHESLYEYTKCIGFPPSVAHKHLKVIYIPCDNGFPSDTEKIRKYEGI
jgi:hypothetical protein